MNTIKNGFKLLVFIVFLFQFSHLQAQTKKIELNKNKTVSNEISLGERHQFTVQLDANQFAFFRLVQQGVDLSITTFDANGKKIEDFDSPNGKNGPELFYITSSNKGNYMFEVRPLDENEPIGKYELRIEKIEAKAKTPEKEVDQLFTPWDSKETPGAAVAVVKDGKIIYKKGYGMANLEYDIPIEPSTIFHIASVSKQFTTFSILLLEKDGKLSLDDDVRKYIPEVPDFGKKITLRHLAHHTSGLRDQWALIAMAGGRLDDVITKDHIMKLVSRQKDLNFEPGEEYLYSNTGYTLLAEVVARVSGKSFPEFTEERIFKPLNMKNTLFYDNHQKIVKNRAYSYFPVNNGFIKLVLSYANVGATSLFTTVEDLSLWAMNFENPKVGDREIMNKMKTQGVLNNGNKINYALGQSVGKYHGTTQISHGGGDAGYRTYLIRLPDEKFSVVVFSNDGAFNAGGMAHKVLDIYLRDQITAKEKADLKDKPVEKPTEKEAKTVAVEESILKDYVGSYELFPNFIIKITQENGKLFGQATGQGKLELVALSPTKFSVKEVQAEVTFQRDENNRVNLLKLNQGGQIQDAKRIKPFDPESVDPNDFTGSFYSEELATEYVFTVENGKLIAKHSRLEDIIMTPVKEDTFSANTWFFSQIEFIRDENNKINGCKVSNGRVRNLFFEKRK